MRQLWQWFRQTCLCSNDKELRRQERGERRDGRYILLRWAGYVAPQHPARYDEADNRQIGQSNPGTLAQAVSSGGRNTPDSRQVFAERDQGVGEINKRLDSRLSTRMTAP